jgi:AcrR family transcriptional regulator
MAATRELARSTVDNPVADRILDGALACIGRVGLAKTTFDDVAKEAGLSRATVYRHFAGRRPLLLGLVAREAGRLAEVVRAAVATTDTAADALVAAAGAAVEHLESVEALRFVLEHEPDIVMPFLALDRANQAFAAAAAIAVELLEPWLDAPLAGRAGEWLARLVTAYIVSLDCADGAPTCLADPDAVRALVADFVVPGLISISTRKGELS